MNKITRTSKLAEALNIFEEQKPFYAQRLERAARIVFSVWQKQYMSKVFLHRVEEHELFYGLWGAFRIRSVELNENSQQPVLSVDVPSSKHRIVTGEVNPVFIHGSDRDIAKYARASLNKLYDERLEEQISDYNSPFEKRERKLLEWEVRNKQKQLRRKAEEYETAKQQYYSKTRRKH